MAELDTGEIGSQVLGWVGALTVVGAGGNASDPTFQRVGLALKDETPKWSCAKVTLVAGIATTAVTCFPFVFTGLLDYVALYGLLICPIGAIVVTEHWTFPRTGLNRFWATGKGWTLNWAAFLTWRLSVAPAVALQRGGTLHLFFLFLPVYGFAMVAYWLLARAMGAAETESAGGPTAASAAPSQGHALDLPEPSGPSSSPGAVLSGTIAAGALACCLWLGYLVVAAPAGGYEAALADLHVRLAIPTVICFVAGTVFLTPRERRAERDLTPEQS